MDAQTQNDINRLVRALYKVSEGAKKETRAILAEAAMPVIQMARNSAPVSKAVHYRYKYSRKVKGYRRAKGEGEIVATYRPGNLRDSIKGIFFRRASNSVFIGPVLARKPTGVFGPEYSFIYDDGGFKSRTDGYYATFVEFGVPEMGISPQPFMRPAVTALPKAGAIAVKELTKTVNRYWEKYAAAKGR